MGLSDESRELEATLTKLLRAAGYSRLKVVVDIEEDSTYTAYIFNSGFMLREEGHVIISYNKQDLIDRVIEDIADKEYTITNMSELAYRAYWGDNFN